MSCLSSLPHVGFWASYLFPQTLAKSTERLNYFQMRLLIMNHCVGKRGSLLAQIQALNWPSWELRCHAWALCHMWVFESLLLHFWALILVPTDSGQIHWEQFIDQSPLSTCLSNILGVLSQSSSLFSFNDLLRILSWIWRKCLNYVFPNPLREQLINH